MTDGNNTRDGAQVLVESNVFVRSSVPLYNTNAGYAVARGNDFGGASNAVLQGAFTSVPYRYSLFRHANVKATVVRTAGATLSF